MSKHDEFLASVQPREACILWPGAKTPEGYGRMRYRGKTVAAHRHVYEYHNGPVPNGLFVCHRCDVPSCVNPAHLFVGTHVQNMADMRAKGRAGAWGRAVTHCPQGHNYSDVNTYVHRGSRYCKECVRTRARERQRMLRKG